MILLSRKMIVSEIIWFINFVYDNLYLNIVLFIMIFFNKKAFTLFPVMRNILFSFTADKNIGQGQFTMIIQRLKANVARSQ